jgi:hypothetical protein
VRAVPWWGLLSSGAAPVFLIGGWTLAAELQPGAFDPTVQTISALAAYGATHREVMTLAFVAVGISHLVTALALRPAALPGRLSIAAAGAANLAVAAAPLPDRDQLHRVAAAVALGAPAVWPALAWRRRGSVPPILRALPSVLAAVVLCGLLGWFLIELLAGGTRVGLAERVAAGAQNGWPLVVVAGCRAQDRRPPA